MKNKPKICIVGNMLTLPYSPDHAGIIQGLKELDLDYFIADPVSHYETGMNIVDSIISYGPDLIIHGMTDSLSNNWPQHIKRRLPGAIQVMSMWDYRPRDMNYDGLWSNWIESGPALDLITLSNKGQLKWWADSFNTKTEYWPHGCYVGKPEFDKEFKYNVVFTGSRNEGYPYNERVKLIDKISEGIKVDWVNEGGGDSSPARIKVWKNLGKIYHSSNIVLDVSHFWDDPGYVSGRYFYSSGLGGCAVTKRFPDCEELYPEGIKYYFDTPEEAIDKIKWLLDNPNIMAEIKKKAWEYNKKHHSYKTRFKQLLKWIQ